MPTNTLSACYTQARSAAPRHRARVRAPTHSGSIAHQTYIFTVTTDSWIMHAVHISAFAAMKSHICAILASCFRLFHHRHDHHQKKSWRCQQQQRVWKLLSQQELAVVELQLGAFVVAVAVRVLAALETPPASRRSRHHPRMMCSQSPSLQAGDGPLHEVGRVSGNRCQPAVAAALPEAGAAVGSRAES